MKKLLILIILLLGTSIYSQSEETDQRTVKYLLNQINSLNFKSLEDNKSYAFVGKVDGVSVYWYRLIENNNITYCQVMKQFGKYAKGHTIITDLKGKNAHGTHEIQLVYE